MRKFTSVSLLACLAIVSQFGSVAVAATQTSGASSEQSFPIDDALIADRLVKHSYSITAVNLSQQKVTIAWNQQAGPKAKFEGHEATTVVSNFTNTVDGKLNYVAIDTEYFSASDHTQLGTLVDLKGRHGDGRRYSVVTKSYPLPKHAKIGESGKYEEIVGYSDFKKSKILDHRTSSWSLERDPKSSADALFCTSMNVIPARSPDVIQSEKECYHLDTEGHFSSPFELDAQTTLFH